MAKARLESPPHYSNKKKYGEGDVLPGKIEALGERRVEDPLKAQKEQKYFKAKDSLSRDSQFQGTEEKPKGGPLRSGALLSNLRLLNKTKFTSDTTSSKPGTAQVGAISKAQK